MLRCPRNRKNACVYALCKWEGYALNDSIQGRCKSGDLPCVLEIRFFRGDAERIVPRRTNGVFGRAFFIPEYLGKLGIREYIFLGGVS